MRFLPFGLAWMLLAGCNRTADRPAPPPGRPPGPPPAALLTPIARVPSNLPSVLKPGEYFWVPDASPAGPTVLVVSLPEQRAYVYRNGVAIGVSTVSTGKRGHRTPTGVFTILQKKERHISNIYHSPMPYMQRLTWSGIALHAGALPGYPASHGCVRLPLEFARKIFSTTDRGTTVIISDYDAFPNEVVYPGLLAPVSEPGEPLAPGEFVWEPEKAPEGPVTVLLSRPDRTIYVFRNGVQIARARVSIRRPLEPLGDVVFTVLEGKSTEPSPLAPGQPQLRWMAVGLSDEVAAILREDIYRRVMVPPEFARRVYDLLTPGVTVVVTDLPSTRETRSKQDFTVMTADAGTEQPAPGAKPQG